jgi:hypothetical protein
VVIITFDDKKTGIDKITEELSKEGYPVFGDPQLLP